jgi:hypothetical protein
VAWGVHLLALTYDVERIVLGGGVSHAGEPFMAPIRRELDRFRDASPLAREVLVPGLVELLPPGADAGAWGAVTVAREALAAERTTERGLGAPDARGREVGTPRAVPCPRRQADISHAPPASHQEEEP